MSEQSSDHTGRIDVAYVARLARLYLTDEERRVFGAQLEDIVGYIRKISRLDLSGIEPTSHAHPVMNVFRQDEVKLGLDLATVLRNAPVHTGDQFTVPKIIE